MEARQCSRCHVAYPADLVKRAFRGVSDASLTRGRGVSRVCRPCEQTAKDEKKQRNRYVVKARDTRRRHALRLDVTVDELIRRGWDEQRMAHDIEFLYGNGCGYCSRPYKEMGHGLGDITLDIQDPERPPDYRTNTKWCCQTCNRKKGRLSPEDFEADQQLYHLWERRPRDPFAFEDEGGTGSLFGEAS